MVRRLLSAALVVQTLCSRASPAYAFAWPSAAVASLRASQGGRPFSSFPARQRVRVHSALPGRVRVRNALFGALPVTVSLAAGLQLRATSSGPPDETWEVVRTPGDGSCLFHAVEAAAGRSAQDLRVVAADAVEANADVEFNDATLRQWILWETEMTPEQYAARMKVGKWGGQIELCLLARGLDTPIEVYNQLPSKGQYELQHTFPPASANRASADPIRLVYNGAHYDALLRPGSTTTTAKASGDSAAAPHGGALGQALVTAVLQKGFRFRFGQCVDGHPVPKEGDHTATVIWLHGLGDSGFGWAPVAEQAKMPWVKFLFPTAPVQRVTLNMGMEMPAWFDIKSLDPDDLQEDVDGMLESAAYVMGLVQKEIENGIPPERIALVGFSQGGAISLTAALMMAELPFAGCVALSTWLPLFAVAAPKGLKHPYLMCHGDADPVVQYRWGKGSFDKLQDMGASAQFKTYPGMDHNFCPQEAADVASFLRTVLPPK